MGRNFDLTDFTGPTISLLYNESINDEEKAIFIILLNSKSVMECQFLGSRKASLKRKSHVSLIQTV